jgi:hypothetical protein
MNTIWFVCSWALWLWCFNDQECLTWSILVDSWRIGEFVSVVVTLVLIRTSRLFQSTWKLDSCGCTEFRNLEIKVFQESVGAKMNAIRASFFLADKGRSNKMISAWIQIHRYGSPSSNSAISAWIQLDRCGSPSSNNEISAWIRLDRCGSSSSNNAISAWIQLYGCGSPSIIWSQLDSTRPMWDPFY